MVLFVYCLRSTVSRSFVYSVFIKYKDIDTKVSICALKMFTGHLWYVSSEMVVHAFFDLWILIEVKNKMVDTQNTNKTSELSGGNSVKWYKISLESIYFMQDKYIYHFINRSLNKLF